MSGILAREYSCIYRREYFRYIKLKKKNGKYEKLNLFSITRSCRYLWNYTFKIYKIKNLKVGILLSMLRHDALITRFEWFLVKKKIGASLLFCFQIYLMLQLQYTYLRNTYIQIFWRCIVMCICEYISCKKGRDHCANSSL